MNHNGQRRLSRCAQLKLLNVEVRRLFEQSLCESEAYDVLRIDPRFEHIRRTTICSMYKALRNERDKPKSKKEKVNGLEWSCLDVEKFLEYDWFFRSRLESFGKI